jgi:PadR family transcriptional regulator PadR
MARPERTTRPLLDVSECLLRADRRGEALHGWLIMKDTKRAGTTVYKILDRLEDLGWITSYWETLGPDENRPRRRLYRLTSDGRAEVEQLLAERRPEVLKSLADPARRGPQRRSPRVLPGGV